MKEKQLQSFEEQLAVSQAEAENERGRLNTLIQRLENTLLQQGSEVSTATHPTHRYILLFFIVVVDAFDSQLMTYPGLNSLGEWRFLGSLPSPMPLFT